MSKANPKVVSYSIIGLIFLYLTFTTHWLLIIPAAILSWLSWKELMGK